MTGRGHRFNKKHHKSCRKVPKLRVLWEISAPPRETMGEKTLSFLVCLKPGQSDHTGCTGFILPISNLQLLHLERTRQNHHCVGNLCDAPGIGLPLFPTLWREMVLWGFFCHFQTWNLWLACQHAQSKEQRTLTEMNQTGRRSVSSSGIKCTSIGDEFENSFYLLSWWFIQCVCCFFLFYPFISIKEIGQRSWTGLLWFGSGKRGDIFSPFLMLMKRGAFPALACRACLSCSMLHCLDIVRAQKSRPGIQ